ncbi:MAG: ABC transporter substrate-binding protein, partial [Chloroflexota bacterium]
MSKKTLSRRDFLHITAGVGLAIPAAGLLAACGGGGAAAPSGSSASTSASAAPGSALASASAPALASASAPASSTAASPSASGAAIKGTINFWSRENFNNGTREPLLKQQAAAFGKAHPGVTTHVQFMAFAESIQKEQAAVAAGDPPELGEQGPDVGTQYAAAGDLLDLTQIAGSLKTSFANLQKDAYVTYKGKTYGIPWYSETRVLFYHKDLLDRAGVTPPTTWAEWTQAAQKLTTAGQYGYAVGMETTWPGQLWIPLGISNGGRVLDETGKVVSDSPQMKEALQFITDFYTKYKTMPAATPTYKNNDLMQLFMLKKIAMFWYNGELLQSIQQSKPEILKTLGAVKVPVNKASDTSRSFLGGFDLFVFAKSAQPQAGIDLLKSMYQEPWYTKYVEATNSAALPITKAAINSDFYQKNELLKTLVDQLPTAVRYGGPDYGNTAWTGAAEGKLLFSQPVVDVIN